MCLIWKYVSWTNISYWTTTNTELMFVYFIFTANVIEVPFSCIESFFFCLPFCLWRWSALLIYILYCCNNHRCSWSHQIINKCYFHWLRCITFLCVLCCLSEMPTQKVENYIYFSFNDPKLNLIDYWNSITRQTLQLLLFFSFFLFL